MKFSPEKQIHLAQQVAKHLAILGRRGEIQSTASELQLRQRVLDTIRAFVKRDDECAANARQKIRSQKRDIPEGSAEWDTLFRQYYDAELDRLRKVLK